MVILLCKRRDILGWSGVCAKAIIPGELDETVCASEAVCWNVCDVKGRGIAGE
jgi:hypothetical protein